MKKNRVLIGLAVFCFQIITTTQSLSQTTNVRWRWASMNCGALTVWPGLNQIISVPDFGSNAVYTWVRNGTVSIVNQTRNQVTFNAYGNAGDVRALGCVVKSIDGTDEIYDFSWTINISIPSGTSESDYPISGSMNIGDQITFILPNFGTPTYGVTYEWTSSQQFSINSSNRTATLTAMTAATGAWAICFVKFNGQTFHSFSKSINIINPSGGGGGGGGGGGCLSVQASPNPNNGKFLLKAPCLQQTSADATREIAIFDSSQNQVYQGNLRVNEEIDLQQILSKSGLYVVHMKVDGKIHQAKIIIEK